MYISAMWAVSIHLVTAFLLAGLPSRPFWNTALLGPRFLASAFTAGPAFVILLLYFIKRTTNYDIPEGAFAKLALVTVAAAQINIVMLISELFAEFYSQTHHSINARYLFLGLDGHNALVPWAKEAALAVAGRALHPGAHYLAVFRFAGVTAFAGYGLALLQNSIWYKRDWIATFKAMFDALIYAAMTAGTFGWLWPS